VSRSRSFLAGAVVGLAGVALLVVQTARALSGNTLGTIATDLLWVGVGLLVAGGALLLTAVVRSERAEPDLDGGQPADG
jgi:hypothetical protein